MKKRREDERQNSESNDGATSDDRCELPSNTVPLSSEPSNSAPSDDSCELNSNIFALPGSSIEQGVTLPHQEQEQESRAQKVRLDERQPKSSYTLLLSSTDVALPKATEEHDVPYLPPSKDKVKTDYKLQCWKTNSEIDDLDWIPPKVEFSNKFVAPKVPFSSKENDNDIISPRIDFNFYSSDDDSDIIPAKVTFSSKKNDDDIIPPRIDFNFYSSDDDSDITPAKVTFSK